MITQSLLKELFSYKEGCLYWRQSNSVSNVKEGQKAGYFNKDYYKVKVNGKSYLLHRLIFLYHHGFLPEEVDHEDLNKLNNNISNLRAATKGRNQMNKPKRANTFSKYKGVSQNYNSNTSAVLPFRARISLNKRTILLGYFATELDAAVAYNNASEKYHKEFAYPNPL